MKNLIKEIIKMHQMLHLFKFDAFGFLALSSTFLKSARSAPEASAFAAWNRR